MHWQADQSRRRRSANADILESLGLPSTGSYNDMKSLQDGPRRDRGGCLRAVAAAATAIGASTARAFSSSALRISQKMAAPAAACRKRQMRKKTFSKNGCWLCESEAESLQDHEKRSSLYCTYEDFDAKPATRGEPPVLAVSPGQWLRQRGGYMACD